MPDENKKDSIVLDFDFLDSTKLTKDQHERILGIYASKDLRVLVFSKIQEVFTRKAPQTIEEAAVRYYEVKGLMGLIPNIQKTN